MTLPATVTVTRSKHPLEGRTLRLLGKMRRHGHEELLVVLDDGTKSLLDASWTDCASVEAGPAPTSTLGTLGDLLAASALARGSCQYVIVEDLRVLDGRSVDPRLGRHPATGSERAQPPSAWRERERRRA